MRPAGRFILERRGLAAASLQGVARARRFVETVPKACTAFSTSLRRHAGPAEEQDDQLLFGELFDVLTSAEGYALGQARRNGYVGYVPEAALGDPGPLPTHRVSALRAYAYAEPDFKTAAAGPLPFGALVCVEAEHRRYRKITGLGWIGAVQLAPIGVFERDPAAVAERFVGAPYLWGGRDGLGIDCSGLIQQALNACGVGCPRDTDQQAALGTEIAPSALRRGDLVCWTGHAGMMVDSQRLIHANTFHMAVAIEPLAEAAERIRQRTGEAPTTYRRL